MQFKITYWQRFPERYPRKKKTVIIEAVDEVAARRVLRNFRCCRKDIHKIRRIESK